MTITVSLEELSAYQTKMISWGVKRGAFIQGMLFGRREMASVMGDFDQRDHLLLLREIEKWEAQNPPPHLIPSV